MSLRSHALILVLALALVLGSTMALASPKYAVTASLNKVFLLKYEGQTVTSSLLATVQGASLAGIATKDGKLYVADATPAGDAQCNLRVGKIINALTNPSIEWICEPIPLISGSDVLAKPSEVAVDASGGVYVLGGAFDEVPAAYAYVSTTNDWGNSAVAIAKTPSSSLADITIAEPSDKAIIALRDDSSNWADQSCVRSGQGGSAGDVRLLDDSGYYPRGIAAGTGGVTYMVNYSTEVVADDGPSNVGSISVVDSETLGKKAKAVVLDGFRPTDVAFFTVGTTNYLGVVGSQITGKSQAWRIALDANGIPSMSDVRKTDLDSSTNHYCTTSDDGTLFWATNPQSNSVTLLATDTWASTKTAIGSSVSRIAWIDPGATVIIVPPPVITDLPTQLYMQHRPFVGVAPGIVQGEGITFSGSGPDGMTINPTTGVVSWSDPVKNSPCTPYTVSITATSAGGATTKSFALSLFPKEAEDGDEVATAKMFVTAAFADSFYIESRDRLWGMWVSASEHGLLVNYSVDVHGTMATDPSGERVINSTEIKRLTDLVEITPIYFPLRWLGGGDFLCISGLTQGQVGVTGGWGVNTIGLVVKAFGMVEADGVSANSFLLNDGSGVKTRVLAPTDAPMPAAGSLVMVTGISSMALEEGDTVVRIRVIKGRNAWYYETVTP